jgi:hypothetical protein
VSEDSRQLDEARARAGDLIAMIDALGADVGVEDIQRAALIELTPAATQAVFNLGCLTLTNMDCMAAILSGCCSEERISMFANFFRPMPESAPKALARRPRRPRLTAADRARAATEWLNGPAWTIVDPDPSPSPTEGAPDVRRAAGRHPGGRPSWLA